MITNHNIFITGGTGTLGKAIIKRYYKDNSITVLSRDVSKQDALLREYPKVKMISGDVSDLNTFMSSMAGHDLVIHAAAFKYVVEGERDTTHMINTNVIGSMAVIEAAIYNKVKRVIGISTDKACYPINAYGNSKALMERLFIEAALKSSQVEFSLVRYGNVIGSTGSVVNVWQKMVEKQGYIEATDPNMTRFFMTVDDAVDLIELGTKTPNGTIAVPMKIRSLGMGQFKEFVMPDVRVEYKGIRGGEKLHETLVTFEEQSTRMMRIDNQLFIIAPKGADNKSPLSFYLRDFTSNMNFFSPSKDELLGVLSGKLDRMTGLIL